MKIIYIILLLGLVMIACKSKNNSKDVIMKDAVENALNKIEIPIDTAKEIAFEGEVIYKQKFEYLDSNKVKIDTIILSYKNNKVVSHNYTGNDTSYTLSDPKSRKTYIVNHNQKMILFFEKKTDRKMNNFEVYDSKEFILNQPYYVINTSSNLNTETSYISKNIFLFDSTVNNNNLNNRERKFLNHLKLKNKQNFFGKSIITMEAIQINKKPISDALFILPNYSIKPFGEK